MRKRSLSSAYTEPAFCVGYERTSFSHLDSSFNSIGLLAVSHKLRFLIGAFRSATGYEFRLSQTFRSVSDV